MERYKEAIKLYDKCIELNPEYSNSYFSKGKINNYNQGISLDNLCMYKEAILMYNKALALNPKFYEAF